jgi:hypothetical protein
MPTSPATCFAAFWRWYCERSWTSVFRLPVHRFEWLHIKQDLKALKQVIIEENGKRFAIRSECKGNCGKIFQAVGVALPPTIRAVE